jgi:TatA/E family protein of Tat protein translocase
MFGLSSEHLLLLAIVLLFFGPRQLPTLGSGLGRATRKFKEALSGVQEPKFRKLREVFFDDTEKKT